MKQQFFVSIYHDRTTGNKPNPKDVHLRTNDEYSGEKIVLTENAALVLNVLSQSSGIQMIMERFAQAGFRLGWKKAFESQKPESVETA